MFGAQVTQRVGSVAPLPRSRKGNRRLVSSPNRVAPHPAADTTAPSPAARSAKLVPVAVLLMAGVYLSGFAYRGWIPADAGTLGQCAERVFCGEIPHRDFDDMYTGGLSYLHAAAFRVFGFRLSSIRTVFFVFVLAFVLAAYAIAARAAPAWIAGLVVIACVGWSVPNYFAALPSWYNLFFATFGMLALLKYTDTQRRYWLFVAGFFGGLGILAKIVALYYIGAAGFFLVYRTQLLARQKDPRPTPVRRGVMLAVPGVVSAVWLGCLWMLVHRHVDSMLVLQFLVPSAAVCAALIGDAWGNGGGMSKGDLAGLARDLLAMSLGVLLPIACFLLPFVGGDALVDLFRGVFVTPQLRLDHAGSPLPPTWAMILTVPVACLLALGLTRLGKRDGWLTLGVAPALAGLLWLASNDLMNQAIFLAVRCAVPLVAVLAAWLLLSNAGPLSLTRRQELFLVITMMAFICLVQFPLSVPIYFCYVAPLAGLAIQFLLASQPYPPRRVQLCILVFLLVFALGFLNRRTFFDDPRIDRLDPPVNRLALDRAGLFVSMRDKVKYENLVRLVNRYSPPGSYIYATPDCPEVYFLSERKNPTRTLFDFFDTTERRTERQLALIERHNIRVVVINLRPGHSEKVDPQFVSAIATHFPYAAKIDNFLVAYRVPGCHPVVTHKSGGSRRTFWRGMDGLGERPSASIPAACGGWTETREALGTGLAVRTLAG